MEINRVPSPFGRASAADEAHPSRRRSTSSFRRAPGPGFSSLKIGTAFAIATVLCSSPGAAYAQRHQGSRGHNSHEQLSALTCRAGSLTGAGTDTCSVKLSQTAGSGGFTVSLGSSNSAVKVPASVTVSSGASSTGFTATASAVTSAQAVTLTASDSSNSKTYALRLKPAATGTAALTLGSTNVAFGNVSLNTPATQTVQVKSSGTSALTISGATLKGTGFSLSGITTPLTLSPSQTATLDLQFDPKAAGSDTGTVTISSNAASGAASIVALSGTGTTAGGYEVQLNWAAPASSGDAVAGYNVYRAANGGAYQKVNSSANQPATYTDTTVQSGTTYTYEVMSVDASGVQSAPSNVYSAAVP